MAPSADAENGSKIVQNNGPVEKFVETIGQDQDKNPGNGDNINQNDKSKVVEKGEPAVASEEGKLSGKQLKEKAKAEKAANRARKKQAQQGQPIVDLGTNHQANQKPRTTDIDAAVSSPPSPKAQHKRTGSTGGNAQKLPLRPSQSSTPPPSEVPVEENKNVAMFEHLYGPPRRTSIAGAGKDVHHAVLALGLQMGQYVICGSNARCVATLLVFKRVRGFPPLRGTIIDCPGHRILRYTSAKLSAPASYHPSVFPDRVSCLLPANVHIDGQCNSMAKGSNFSCRCEYPGVHSED